MMQTFQGTALITLGLAIFIASLLSAGISLSVPMFVMILSIIFGFAFFGYQFVFPQSRSEPDTEEE